MSHTDLLIKGITLLFRENELGESHTNNSKELVKNVVATIKDSKNKIILGGESILLTDLCNITLDLVNNQSSYDRTTLIENLSVTLKDKENLLRVVEKNIGNELTPEQLKRSVISYRRQLETFINDFKIVNVISKASYLLNNGKLEAKTTAEHAAELINTLESLTVTHEDKDPGVVDEIDIFDEEALTQAYEDVKSISNKGGKFITGWKKLNKMLNGGFRKGEQWVVSALQHNYKSGFVQSLFIQYCTLNIPIMKDPSKKPLNVLFSFEDDINIIIEFMYRYLYYNEFKELPDITALTGKEISSYIIKKLSVNGFHVKILRVNPSEWTYKNIFNKILEYEADGYEVHSCIIDYLSKLPTTGCITSGPSGTDVRDLFNRVRNFFSSKGILNVTPHQISTEANNLTRSGIKGFDFINEVANKNYYSESKQIPQVVDGEIYLTKGFDKGKWGLYVGKGKHRTPTITPDEDKQFMLTFPKNAPIPEDLNDTDEVIESIGSIKDFDF